MMEPGSVHRSPRTRGGMPAVVGKIMSYDLFSPHSRGYARAHRPAVGPNAGSPRTRGGMPIHGITVVRTQGFSPHSRGYARAPDMGISGLQVLPALAGVCPIKGDDGSDATGSPRTRGGMPMIEDGTLDQQWFSPHSRGYADQQAGNVVAVKNSDRVVVAEFCAVEVAREIRCDVRLYRSGLVYAVMRLVAAEGRVRPRELEDPCSPMAADRAVRRDTGCRVHHLCSCQREAVGIRGGLQGPQPVLR